MPVAPLYNTDGQEIGQVELACGVFGVPVNRYVLHEAVVMQLASRRIGTHATKTIGEVSGGGAKPWRQKGTGRARHGSRRSPLWRGGATLFGPQPRTYGYRLPKKVRRLALKSALSAKAEARQVIVVEDLKLDVPKTRAMVDILRNLNVGNDTLIVLAAADPNVRLSSRNIPGVKAVLPAELNVYDILNHEKLMITKDALAKVEEVFS